MGEAEFSKRKTTSVDSSIKHRLFLLRDAAESDYHTLHKYSKLKYIHEHDGGGNHRSPIERVHTSRIILRIVSYGNMVRLFEIY